MNKDQKVAAVDALAKHMEGAVAVYLTDYSGLTVEQSNKLRRQFREAGVDFTVAKNTFVRLAMERLGGFDAVLPHLEGPTAIAVTTDPAAPARIIKDFSGKVDVGKPALKAAIIEGSYFGSDALEMLLALKSRGEIVGDIIGLLLSPMSNTIGALQAPGANLVGAIKTIAERGA
ncbi:MAG: 50S ribosomal protein L10 [Rhodothermales bacterium]|jgi:large subunit ribosomal protein L10